MRQTRFMTWVFLVHSLAFLCARNFRIALEAPLFNLVRSDFPSFGTPQHPRLLKLYTFERYVSRGELIRLAEQAAARGDGNLAAFGALTLPLPEARGDARRMADTAVKTDPKLIWIYAPVISRLLPGLTEGQGSDEEVKYVEERIQRLEVSDPTNAVPHLLRAELILQRRGKAWPSYLRYQQQFLNALAQEKEWVKEKETAFASSRYDSYEIHVFSLIHLVLGEHGWDHPGVFLKTYGGLALPSVLEPRDFRNLQVKKLGSEAEALALALRKAGRSEEAELVEAIRRQAKQDYVRWYWHERVSASSNYAWSVVTVVVFAQLVAVFFFLTVVSVIYVNAKLWIRREKKGRLYEIFTTLENYLPPLLLASCLALYLSFAPYGQNFDHYMHFQKEIDYVPENLGKDIFPSYPVYRFEGMTWVPPDVLLPQRPFLDYVPFALLGLLIVAAAGLVRRYLWTRRSHAELPRQM